MNRAGKNVGAEREEEKRVGTLFQCNNLTNPSVAACTLHIIIQRAFTPNEFILFHITALCRGVGETELALFSRSHSVTSSLLKDILLRPRMISFMLQFYKEVQLSAKQTGIVCSSVS